MGTFSGHSVSAESSRTTFGALSVSAGCNWQIRWLPNVGHRARVAEARVHQSESLASLCTDYTEEAAELSTSASGTVGPCGRVIVTHRTANMMWLNVKDIR